MLSQEDPYRLSMNILQCGYCRSDSEKCSLAYAHTLRTCSARVKTPGVFPADEPPCSAVTFEKMAHCVILACCRHPHSPYSSENMSPCRGASEADNPETKARWQCGSLLHYQRQARRHDAHPRSLDNNAVPYITPALPRHCEQAVPQLSTQGRPLLHAHVTPSPSLKTCLQAPRAPLFKSAHMHCVTLCAPLHYKAQWNG